MLLERLFRTRPAVSAGRALYEKVVAQSREPGLYTDLAIPDTVEGRFEAYSLHVVLLLDRLRAADAQGRDDAREVSQALFDTYVKSLDHALREMGVGDLSVGKKMRKLGEAFYGRCKSYEAAFAALPDESALTALAGRTLYAGVEAPPTAALAAYVLAERADLALQPLEALVAGEVSWKPL
ncbi:ubiquinol-cytochrome C chaperone family protein [Phenylobacterium sp.]|jgi:cytochrome b pre-mRNA-processing protein 3|uniref:ubiquinol-cytochrome C chaperone family protein n=1 Tax=Phenylobacterium sp. TaxID=1871053 RepID=UPI002F4201E0